MLNIINKENKILKVIQKLHDEKAEVVLYGAGYCGHEALTLLREGDVKVAAICDDFRIGEEIDGETIGDIREITPNEHTVIFITSGFNESMKRNLEMLRLMDHYVELDFGRYDREKETYQWYKNHQTEIEQAYALLEDETSRRWMEELINYKISRDSSSFLGNKQYDKPQYFPVEEGLDLRRKNHVFLDLGAYDGDSCRGFIDYVNGQYEKIIAVEASDINYKKLQTKMSAVTNMELLKTGIYREKGKLKFELNDAKNSFVSEQGTSWLDVDSVDGILGSQRVSFIKMDIEGAEYDALIGAEKTIQRDTPILAVSVYHYTEDLFRLQLLIQEMHPRYKYYLRHYSPTAIETVLYAVPKEEK
ncbi:MAG: FkbM family methyltransferase [Lachnospiraceae bacterium]|nr:FkbM family methyltransferase [Lachnospiraceae bacterium]